jgi:hypothetical protein
MNIISVASSTKFLGANWSIRTTGGSSMVLDSSSLAVKRVVNHPRKLVVGAVEAALESSASRSATQLLSSAEDVALREHGAEGQSNGCCVSVLL